MKIEFKEFEKARDILSEYITPTPLVKNEWLSKKYGANIYLKLENLQPPFIFIINESLFFH